MTTKIELTEEEKLFCQLFVSGTAPYAGNATKCYTDVFHESGINVGYRSRQLLKKPAVQAYILELEEMSEETASGLKRFLTQNLIKIIEETSSAQYCDRRGNPLSPAPLRSVSVQAAKALMDMYPLKEAQVNKINIEGGENGITFNVVVPDAKPEVPGE